MSRDRQGAGIHKACMVADKFRRLVELMEKLRGPQGCPWDREQTRETLKPMLIEEAYEVLAALDHAESRELCDELGDLLFQIVFHAQIAKERGEFDIYEVISGAVEKMTRRHPHVFGNAELKTSGDVLKHWEELKKEERRQRGLKTVEKKSVLAGIPANLPAIYACFQISSKASRVGFDWPDLSSLLDKLAEEVRELGAAVEARDQEMIAEEVGDLLFAAVNVARFVGADPETALGRANSKFIQRFMQMEAELSADGKNIRQADLETMERYWKKAKG